MGLSATKKKIGKRRWKHNTIGRKETFIETLFGSLGSFERVPGVKLKVAARKAGITNDSTAYRIAQKYVERGKLIDPFEDNFIPHQAIRT